MQNFDFTGLINKFPLLQSKDVSFLSNFFNDVSVLNTLSEIESKRKVGFIKVILATLLLGVALAFTIYLLNYLGLFSSDSDNDAIGYIIGAEFLVYGWYTRRIINTFRSNIKNKILSKLVNQTDFEVSYSDSATYFSDNLKDISKNTKLVKVYDRLDFEEDSIEINEEEKGYKITGMEFATSKKSTDSKGRTHYTRNNHGFLMKIKFFNPKYKIKSPITLLTQKDSFEKKYLVLYISYVLIFGITYLLLQDIIVLIIGIIIFAITYIISRRKDKTNLIKLENIEFEEKFNVYGNDGIESRRILTTSFMYRIYDYTIKINKKRKYDYYFMDDYIYINNKLSNDYLEISFYKSLFSNLKDYVEFYLELKNISELAGDLKLSFYDKSFGINNVIK